VKQWLNYLNVGGGTVHFLLSSTLPLEICPVKSN